MAEWGPGDSALSLVLGTQFFQKMQPHQDSRLWIRRQWNEQPRARGHGCFDSNVPKPHSTTRLDLRFWSVIYFYFLFLLFFLLNCLGLCSCGHGSSQSRETKLGVSRPLTKDNAILRKSFPT